MQLTKQLNFTFFFVLFFLSYTLPSPALDFLCFQAGSRPKTPTFSPPDFLKMYPAVPSIPVAYLVILHRQVVLLDFSIFMDSHF